MHVCIYSYACMASHNVSYGKNALIIASSLTDDHMVAINVSAVYIANKV